MYTRKKKKERYGLIKEWIKELMKNRDQINKGEL